MVSGTGNSVCRTWALPRLRFHTRSPVLLFGDERPEPLWGNLPGGCCVADKAVAGTKKGVGEGRGGKKYDHLNR